MKIKQIRYVRRKNLGNYEHEEIELIAELDSTNESTKAKFARLKKDAREALDIPDPESDKPF